mmetsp:Transcript_64300/g.177973  ORF Transcript_64300/g.177973 Transcript_64300/m.177973 type:complete len:132 (+) Transcript_64300:165-560(+)
MTRALSILVAALCWYSASAFSPAAVSVGLAPRTSASPLMAATAESACDEAPATTTFTRRSLAPAFMAAVMGGSMAGSAEAKEGKEKEFEACMSKCVYYCQKPKGSEQKGRSECYGECKPVCKADPKSKFSD